MTSTTASSPTIARSSGAVRPILLATLAAAAANVVLYLLFALLGADYANNALPAPVAVTNVLIMTIPPMLIGMGAVALLSRKLPQLLAIGRWVGAALALVTIAMTAVSGFGALSFLALALMHVVVAVAVFRGLGAISR